jgi:hypothetical protein
MGQSIRPQAEKFGICRIVPPPSFQVHFQPQPQAFRFRPRIQVLSELEACESPPLQEREKQKKIQARAPPHLSLSLFFFFHPFSPFISFFPPANISTVSILQAKARVKFEFLDGLTKFWNLQGIHVKCPVVQYHPLGLYTRCTVAVSPEPFFQLVLPPSLLLPLLHRPAFHPFIFPFFFPFFFPS